MHFSVAGHQTFAATGGRGHVPGQPWVVFVHGAGMDHTVWAQQSRWFGFHGWNVLAIDLPGHGRSAGDLLPTIGAMAEWLVALLDTFQIESASFVGHSMGSLAVLEAAASHAGRVQRVVLIGSAPAMPVHPDLLAAAAANDHGAIDMVNLWGFGYHASIGGSPAPGFWMVGVGERTLERARPGVLHNDLAACHAYRDGLTSAARVRAPTLIVSGEKDQMTPLKSARGLAAALPGAQLQVLDGAGHMLMAERPDAVREALRAHLGAAATP